MCGRDHLTGYTKDHGDSHQVKVTRRNCSHNRHHDGHVTLRQARQHPDKETQKRNNHRNGQRRGLEGLYDLPQNTRGFQQLNEKQDTDDVGKHFEIQRINKNFFDTDMTIIMETEA